MEGELFSCSWSEFAFLGGFLGVCLVGKREVGMACMHSTGKEVGGRGVRGGME
jgi:hypothetical protein